MGMKKFVWGCNVRLRIKGQYGNKTLHCFDEHKKIQLEHPQPNWTKNI